MQIVSSFREIYKKYFNMSSAEKFTQNAMR